MNTFPTPIGKDPRLNAVTDTLIRKVEQEMTLEEAAAVR
jgi:hypothetical protein